jgi:hypothetical protein
MSTDREKFRDTYRSRDTGVEDARRSEEKLAQMAWGGTAPFAIVFRGNAF